jgi:hypothetical protein
VWRTCLARSPTMSPWTAHHTAASSTICPSTACCPGVLAPSSAGATPRGALAHRRVCHPKLPGRGRRERGRIWGGKAAGSAETETDLLLVRDAGGGHGVGETDSKAGAPTIYAVTLWLRALAAAKAGEGKGMGSCSVVPSPMWACGGCGSISGRNRGVQVLPPDRLFRLDRPPDPTNQPPKKNRLNLSQLM